MEAARLRYADRVDQGEYGEDDVLGERGPDRTKACETAVNDRHMVQIGAGVALLTRASKSVNCCSQ